MSKRRSAARSPTSPRILPNNPTYEKVNPAATPILYFALISPNMTLSPALRLWQHLHRRAPFDGRRSRPSDHLWIPLCRTESRSILKNSPRKISASTKSPHYIQAGNVDLASRTLYGAKGRLHHRCRRTAHAARPATAN